LTLARTDQGGGDRFDVAATGESGFNLVLSLDRATCLPVEMTFARPPNQADFIRDQVLADSGVPSPPLRSRSPDMRQETFSFDGYRDVDGIRFPSRMIRSVNGHRLAEWALQEVEVNPRLSQDTFSARFGAIMAN
jgi:hypothetical protein